VDEYTHGVAACPSAEGITKPCLAGVPGSQANPVCFNDVTMKNLSVLLSQLSCGEAELAEQAIFQLASWGSEVVEPLQDQLSHPDAEVRWWAVRALTEVNDERVTELLVQALADPDKGVRWCAGLALRSHPSPEAILALIGMLADTDALARRLAGDALVAIGEPAVLPLEDLMHQEDHLVRLEAVRALAKIGDQRAIPVLFEALDDSSALVEYWASEGLEKMGVGMVLFKPE
jgi:HEAT repeat protein